MTSGKQKHEPQDRDDDRDAATTDLQGSDKTKDEEKPPRTRGHISDYIGHPQGDAQDS